MKIGAIFWNYTEEGKEYGSVAIDDTILTLYPTLKELKFLLKEYPIEKRGEKTPTYEIFMFKKEEK